MKQLFAAFIIMILLIGCKKEEEKNIMYGENKVGFSIQDKDGNDLLNPETPGHWDISQIKLSYLGVDGNKKTVGIVNYDLWKYTDPMYQFNDYYILDLGIPVEVRSIGKNNTSGAATSYITWPDGETTTVCGMYNLGDSPFFREMQIGNAEKFNSYSRLRGPFCVLIVDGNEKEIKMDGLTSNLPWMPPL